MQYLDSNCISKLKQGFQFFKLFSPFLNAFLHLGSSKKNTLSEGRWVSGCLHFLPWGMGRGALIQVTPLSLQFKHFWVIDT